MAEIVKLEPPQASPDTVATLERLLEDARAGKLIGIAYAAMYHPHEYETEVCGEARRSPTFTRGMLKVLDDRLGDLIRRR